MDEKKAWHDVAEWGRMLAAILRQENTNYWVSIKAGNSDLSGSHLNRINITMKTLTPLIQDYLGVTKVLKENKRLEADIRG